MADVKGDPAKRVAGCKLDVTGGRNECPNLKEVGGGFDTDRYRCETCGERFTLYYEDMA